MSMLSQWDDKTLEEAIAGVISVSEYNHVVPYQLATPEQQRFAQAKAQEYLTSRTATGSRSIDEPHPDPVFNAYERWCQIHQLPAVNVQPGTRWAHLSFDLIYTQKAWSPEALEQVKRVLAGHIHRRTYMGYGKDSFLRQPFASLLFYERQNQAILLPSCSHQAV